MPGDPLASPCWRDRGSAAREGRGRCRQVQEGPWKVRESLNEVQEGPRAVQEGPREVHIVQKGPRTETFLLAFPEVGWIITLF